MSIAPSQKQEQAQAQQEQGLAAEEDEQQSPPPQKYAFTDKSKYRDKSSAVEACSRYGYALRDASAAMRDEKAVVATAVAIPALGVVLVACCYRCLFACSRKLRAHCPLVGNAPGSRCQMTKLQKKSKY